MLVDGMLSDRLSVRLQDQCDLEYLRQKTGMSSSRSKTVARIGLAFIGGTYVLSIGIRVFERRTEGKTSGGCHWEFKLRALSSRSDSGLGHGHVSHCFAVRMNEP